MKCKCGGLMKPGQVLATVPSKTGLRIGQKVINTQLSTGKLTSCMKCTKCGRSLTM